MDSSDCDSLVASSDGVCSLPICARFGGGVSLSSRVSNGVGNLVASITGTLFSVRFKGDDVISCISMVEPSSGGACPTNMPSRDKSME